MYSSIPVNIIKSIAIPALLAHPCNAVSHEADYIQKFKSDIVYSAEQSIALFGGKEQVISMICEIEAECGVSDWDGYGASPVSYLSALKAKEFVRCLPANLPMPEVAPEPDGSLSLDWMTSKSRRFSVSVGNTDRLAYAWIDGSDQGHAVARFDVETIPSRILEGIVSITA